MENIRVSKAQLLDTLRTNRDEHRDIFLKAQEKFRERCIEELDRMLEDAKKGGEIRQHVGLPVPVDYTREYDRVIKLLEWDLADEIELSEKDFGRYVLNQWEWAQLFASNSTAYLNGGV